MSTIFRKFPSSLSNSHWYNCSTKYEIAVVIVVALVGHFGVVWLPEYPPLYDFPNHMARHYLENLSLGGESLPIVYGVDYGLMPNLGGDLIIPVLIHFFPVVTAGKIFLSFSLLLFGFGAVLYVSQQHDYKSGGVVAALLIVPWLLNYILFMGFINCYAGLGATLLVFWNYRRLYEKRILTRTSIYFHTVLVTTLFFWHLTAIGLYFILVLGHLVFRAIRDRMSSGRYLIRGTPLIISGIPALLLIVWYSFTGTNECALSGIIEHSPIREKMAHSVTGLFGGYFRWIDVFVFTCWLIAIWASFSLKTRKIISWNWLYAECAVLLIVYLLLPARIGATFAVYRRMLPILFVCVVAVIGALPLRMPRLGLWIVAMCLVVRLISIGYAWNKLSDDIAAHLDELKKLPEGSTLLINNQYCDVYYKNTGHAAAWAVPERNLIVSSLFAIPGAQPLTNVLYRNDTDSSVIVKRDGHLEADEKKVGIQFQYLWLCNQSGYEFEAPHHWKLLHQYKAIALWQISTCVFMSDPLKKEHDRNLSPTRSRTIAEKFV